MPVAFDQPEQLAWLSAAALVLLAHLPQGGYAPHAVSSLSIWEEALAMRPRRFPWRRTALIGLQLLVVVAAALALAQPRWRGSDPRGRRLVLVLDGSASMQARQGDASRFDLAKRALERTIERMDERDQAALLGAGSSIKLLCGMTDDRRQLLAALRQASPGEGSADLPGAIAIAARAAGEPPRGMVVVASDGCFEDAAPLSTQPNIKLVSLGKSEPPPNLAITRLSAQPAAHAPHTCRVFVEAANFSDRSTVAPLALEIDGRVVAKDSLDLPPGVRRAKSFDLTLDKPTMLNAILQANDSLTADNRASVRAVPSPRIRVRLHGERSAALENTLQQTSLIETLAGDKFDERRPTDVAVHYRRVPAQLPPGPSIVIEPEESCDLWTVGEPLENVGVVRSLETAAPCGAMRWDLVIFESLARLEFKPPAKTLVADERGAAVVSLIERPSGDVLVLHAQLDRSDLPQHPAFRDFLQSGVLWLSKANLEFVDSPLPKESDLRPASNIAWSEAPVPPRRSLFEPLAASLLIVSLAALVVESILQRAWPP